MTTPAFIIVGRVRKAHGVRGEVVVEPITDAPDAIFASGRRVFAGTATGELAPNRLELHVATVRPFNDGYLVGFAEVPDRTAAEALRGTRVFIGRASFPTPEPDEFYWVDLIGMNVVNRAGEKLGTVAGLIDTGPHSVLRVTPEAVPAGVSAQEAERLIPFVGAYVDTVSLEQRLITVDWGTDY